MQASFSHWIGGLMLTLVAPLIGLIGVTQLVGRVLPNYTLIYESIRTGEHRLYLYDLPRSLEQPLNFTDARAAAIAPDGRGLAFMTVDERTLQVGLYTGDFYEASAEQIHTGSGFLSQITWSPDGTAIAFLSALNLYRDVIVYETVTGRLIPLTDNERCDSLAWSPDSRQVAVICLSEAGFPPEMQIRIYDRAQPDAHRVISVVDIYATASLDWSPDGRFLMVVTEVRGYSPHITLIDLSDVSVHYVAPTGLGISPSFAHDGERIAHHAPALGGGTYTLYLAETDAAGDPAGLSMGRNLAVPAVNIPTFTPAWSPDDAYIVFSGYEGSAMFAVTTLVADARFGGVRWRIPDPFPFNVEWLP